MNNRHMNFFHGLSVSLLVLILSLQLLNIVSYANTKYMLYVSIFLNCYCQYKTIMFKKEKSLPTNLVKMLVVLTGVLTIIALLILSKKS